MSVKEVLGEKEFSFFENENKKGKNGAYAGSEWTPYNLTVIKQWIDMRQEYAFTDAEEDIYKGDWEKLDIKEYHSKYGTNYIFIDPVRKLWRVRQTGNEFYNGIPYKRPKTTEQRNIETIEKMVENGELAYGLEKDNVPVTMNDLIKYCNKAGISLDAPLLLQCDAGYYPLAYYHSAEGTDADGKEYAMGCLAITIGEM